MRWFKFMAMAIAFIVLSSCADSVALPDVEQNEISLSENQIEFAYTSGGSADICVRTAGEWYVEGMTEGIQTWLSLSETEGSDTTVVRVQCNEENLYSTVRLAVLTFKAGDASANVVVRQVSDPQRSVGLSVDMVDFSGKAEEVSVVQLETTKSWTIEGYTDDVKSWLQVTPSSGEGGGEIRLQTISVNEGPAVREAVIGFRIDRINCVWLTIVQQVFIETRQILWESSYLKAPEGAEYDEFPYFKEYGFSETGIFYDGKDGEQTAVGSVREVRTYLIQNVGTTDWIPIEFGPVVGVYDKPLTYYCNNNNPSIRAKNAYIKVPAIEGFRLTHVYVTSGNASSVLCITISSDDKGRNEIEDCKSLNFGKQDPIDVELTETQVNTPYYVVTDSDRLIDSFKFTYTKVI